MRSWIRWVLLGAAGASAVSSCASGRGSNGEHVTTGTIGPGGAHGSGGGPAGSGGNGGASTATTTTTTSASSSSSSSSSSSASSSASSAGGNCKTTCLGVECGMIPDGCGGTIDCGDCGGPPGETCISMTPVFQSKVKAAVEQSKVDHPEYFDFTNTNPPGGGDSVAVVMPMEFDAYVVAQVDGNGDTCISDPNDAQEIRVKGLTDAAENYRIRVLVGPNAPNGYCAYKYQSTCSPAGF